MSEAIRYAMIKDGKVENVCLWDGDVSKWTPPADMLVIPAPDHIGVGWRYIDQEFIESEMPKEEPTLIIDDPALGNQA